MNEYTERLNQITEALRGVLVVPKGRRVVRFRHGGRDGEYWIQYCWSRTHANPFSGMVYDVELGRGKDFEAALADAVAKQAKKRAKQQAA